MLGAKLGAYIEGTEHLTWYIVMEWNTYIIGAFGILIMLFLEREPPKEAV